METGYDVLQNIETEYLIENRTKKKFEIAFFPKFIINLLVIISRQCPTNFWMYYNSVAP